MVCFKSSKLVLTAAVFGALMAPSYSAQASGFLTSAMDAPRSGFILINANQSEERQAGAQQFISTMAQSAIGFISDDGLNGAAKTKAFEKLLRNDFDLKKIRFSEYGGQEIEVRKARPEGKKDILVSSAIVGGDGPEIDVDWRVRYSAGKYQVIDVVVEGVSMALTQRSEFASVIQRGGGSVDVLIAHLEK